VRYALEESGYLKRKPDPSDARAVLFSLTARGAALEEKLSRSITI
jgi:DNA-binding MarR family transcriptional regulator